MSTRQITVADGGGGKKLKELSQVRASKHAFALTNDNKSTTFKTKGNILSTQKREEDTKMGGGPSMTAAFFGGTVKERRATRLPGGFTAALPTLDDPLTSTHPLLLVVSSYEKNRLIGLHKARRFELYALFVRRISCLKSLSMAVATIGRFLSDVRPRLSAQSSSQQRLDVAYARIWRALAPRTPRIHLTPSSTSRLPLPFARYLNTFRSTRPSVYCLYTRLSSHRAETSSNQSKSAASTSRRPSSTRPRDRNITELYLPPTVTLFIFPHHNHRPPPDHRVSLTTNHPSFVPPRKRPFAPYPRTMLIGAVAVFVFTQALVRPAPPSALRRSPEPLLPRRAHLPRSHAARMEMGSNYTTYSFSLRALAEKNQRTQLVVCTQSTVRLLRRYGCAVGGCGIVDDGDGVRRMVRASAIVRRVAGGTVRVGCGCRDGRSSSPLRRSYPPRGDCGAGMPRRRLRRRTSAFRDSLRINRDDAVDDERWLCFCFDAPEGVGAAADEDEDEDGGRGGGNAFVPRMRCHRSQGRESGRTRGVRGKEYEERGQGAVAGYKSVAWRDICRWRRTRDGLTASDGGWGTVVGGTSSNDIFVGVHVARPSGAGGASPKRSDKVRSCCPRLRRSDGGDRSALTRPSHGHGVGGTAVLLRADGGAVGESASEIPLSLVSRGTTVGRAGREERGAGSGGDGVKKMRREAEELLPGDVLCVDSLRRDGLERELASGGEDDGEAWGKRGRGRWCRGVSFCIGGTERGILEKGEEIHLMCCRVVMMLAHALRSLKTRPRTVMLPGICLIAEARGEARRLAAADENWLE
ncbi:hypothetical protein R3P38DRAFT_3492764 [Favolaschia claudopus]|uniref:Uncharacterized protein n=1 Tax=Favolaschia claudopus TaxID=2862362 RepID=A0AAW0EEJ0_9AGAR